MSGPKAESVTQEGEPDGWEPEPGWYAEMTPHGDTRMTVSVPVAQLPGVHRALVQVMSEPLSVLYRQKVDRRDPKPQGAPPRDFVAVGVPADRVLKGLEVASGLLYGDARCELWLQDVLGSRLILDHDGVVYAYPDDPAFRDALERAGVPEAQVSTLSERDYVKHWFHAEHDAQEDALVAALHLAEVPHRPG